MTRRKIKLRSMDFSQPERHRTVRFSPLQMNALKAFIGDDGKKKIVPMDEILWMKQTTVGSLRYNSYIEYTKSCKCSGYCECPGQGYTASKSGIEVFRSFQQADIFRANPNDNVSVWFEGDPIE